MLRQSSSPRTRVLHTLAATLTGIVAFVLLLLLGIYAAIRYDTQQDEDLHRRYFPLLVRNEELRSAVAEQQAALRALIISGDPQHHNEFIAGRERYEQVSRDMLGRDPVDPAARATLQRQVDIIDAWLADIAVPEAEGALSAQLTPDQQATILRDSGERVALFRAENDAYATMIDGLIDQRARDLDNLQRWLVVGAIAGGLLIVIWTVVGSLRLVRAIRAPVLELLSVVNAVERGELSRRAAPLDVVEFDHLGDGINHMLDALDRQMTESSLQSIRFVAIVESANDGIVVVDADGVTTVLNPAAATMLDATPADAIGSPAADLGLLTQHEIDAHLSARAVNPRPTVRRQGERVISAMIGSLPSVDARDTRPGLVWVLRDVTELARVDEMKNEFVSIVSHELRTPLTAIKGFTDLILDGEAGDVNETQREFLEIVQTNTDRLVELINDTLDISRIESGRVALHLEPLDPRELVERALATLRPLLEKKSQRVQVDIPADIPLVEGDEARLTQVLTNLISNASKYTPMGGWMTVGAEALETQVALSVSDTGVGIAPDALSRVFDKFYRVDSPLSHEVTGAGLGLSITKSLVEMHGGRITIASRVGVGTTVRFTLPSISADGHAGAYAGEPADQPLVLIAANGDDTEQWERAFASLGVTLAYARAIAVPAIAAEAELLSAAVVIARCGDGEGEPDCLELLDEFRENPALCETPLVALTRESPPPDRLGKARLAPPDAAPADLAAIVGPLLPAEAPAPQRRGRLLLAEDDADVAAALRRQLAAHGYEVTLARDGLATIVRAVEILPDIILLDAHMPKMGAVDVLPQLLASPGTRDVPIVVMSGSAPDARAQFLDLGAADFFAKPIDIDALAQRLDDLLRREAPRANRRR